MNVTADGIIYLLACAANGVAPASEKVGSIDLEELFRQSRQLSVSAAVGVALDKGGLCGTRV